MSASPERFETLTVTQATELGVSGIIREAADGHDVVVQKHGVPVAAVVSMKRFEEIDELERDLRSAALVITRLATDKGKRTTLDQLISSFGFDRTELEKELDYEIATNTLK